MMPDEQPRPPETHTHFHNEAPASGPLAAIPAVVKTFAGIPRDVAVTWAIILACGGLLISQLYLQPLAAERAEERRRITDDRRERDVRDSIVRAQEQESERSREMMVREGALNRAAKEASDRASAENSRILASGINELRVEMKLLELAIKKLTDKQDESFPLIRP